MSKINELVKQTKQPRQRYYDYLKVTTTSRCKMNTPSNKDTLNVIELVFLWSSNDCKEFEMPWQNPWPVGLSWGGCPSVGTGGGWLIGSLSAGSAGHPTEIPPIHHIVQTQEELLPDGQHCSWATLADVWRILEDLKCYWQQPQTNHNLCICACMSTCFGSRCTQST